MGARFRGPRTGHGIRLRLINVHPETACAGRHCVIHNPSDHPLRDAPKIWRADKQVMERQCPHGIGHDDPDDYAYRRSVDPNATSVHGCDGCCATGENT